MPRRSHSPALSPTRTLGQCRFVQLGLPPLTSLTVHAAVLLLGLSAVPVVLQTPRVPDDQTSFDAPPCPEQSEAVCEVTAAGEPAAVPAGIYHSGCPHAPPYESAPPPSPCVEPPDFKWGADDDQPLHEPSRFGFSQDSTPGPAGPSGANYRSRLFDFPGSPDASSVVFVCDASGSILNKMATLEDELQRAVDGLVPVQSFNIVFTEPSRCMALDPNGLLPATAANKQKALHFTDNVTTTGTPDPAFALAFPFGLRPDLIYLVTDGDFPDNRAVLAQVRQLNSSKAVKLNTLAFVNDADTDTEFITLLRQLADENGGAYRRVSESAIVQ